MHQVVKNVKLIANGLCERVRVLVVATDRVLPESSLVYAQVVHGDDQRNDVVDELTEVALRSRLTHELEAVVVLDYT